MWQISDKYLQLIDLWYISDTFKTVFRQFFVTDSFLTDFRQISDTFMESGGPTFLLSTMMILDSTTYEGTYCLSYTHTIHNVLHKRIHALTQELMCLETLYRAKWMNLELPMKWFGLRVQKAVRNCGVSLSFLGQMFSINISNPHQPRRRPHGRGTLPKTFHAHTNYPPACFHTW